MQKDIEWIIQCPLQLYTSAIKYIMNTRQIDINWLFGGNIFWSSNEEIFSNFWLSIV